MRYARFNKKSSFPCLTIDGQTVTCSKYLDGQTVMHIDEAGNIYQMNPHRGRLNLVEPAPKKKAPTKPVELKEDEKEPADVGALQKALDDLRAVPENPEDTTSIEG